MTCPEESFSDSEEENPEFERSSEKGLSEKTNEEHAAREPMSAGDIDPTEHDSEQRNEHAQKEISNAPAETSTLTIQAETSVSRVQMTFPTIDRSEAAASVTVAVEASDDIVNHLQSPRLMFLIALVFALAAGLKFTVWIYRRAQHIREIKGERMRLR